VSCRRPCQDDLHRNEKEELSRLLEETGEELPAGGAFVIDYFLGMEGHISPENLEKDLEKAGHKLDIELIKTVLELLCRYGIAQRIDLDGNGPWYEHLHLGLQHDHLLCTKCGKVSEFNSSELGALAEKIAKKHDFKPLLQKMTVLGLCSGCRNAPNRSGMPLSMAASGEKLKVERLIGGCEIRHRLTAMGLSTGDEIETISNYGPIIINVKGSRLAIGRGLAQKIIVSQINKREL
jgi:Fur family ferric uptake transcriptional regulator